MRALPRSALLSLGVLCLQGGVSQAQEITTHELETPLVPSPAQFDVLLPPSYGSGEQTYPLFLWLHGGGPDGHLEGIASLLESMWSEGTLSEMVVVTPHAGNYPNNYLDFADGSQRRETFIGGELLDHLRATYRVATDRNGTFVGGVSMGGLGSLRLGLKHLDTFAAIIAFEPQIRDSFVVPDYYDVNQAFHDLNHPANIVRDNADAVRDSDIQIYFEVGSEDTLEFFLGANFLHNGRPWLVLQDRGHRLHGCVPDERMGAADQLGKHGAEREDVGPAVDPLTTHLLGRHVGRRPHHRARRGDVIHRRLVASRGGVEAACQPEVHHLDVPCPVSITLVGLRSRCTTP